MKKNNQKYILQLYLGFQMKYSWIILNTLLFFFTLGLNNFHYHFTHSYVIYLSNYLYIYTVNNNVSHFMLCNEVQYYNLVQTKKHYLRMIQQKKMQANID